MRTPLEHVQAPRGGSQFSMTRTGVALSILAPLALPAKACTLVYLAFGAWLLIQHGLVLKRQLVAIAMPLLVLFGLGVCVDYGTVEWRYFAGDVWRITKPVLLLYVGFMAVHVGFRGQAFPKSLVVVGLVYASIYLVRLAIESILRGVAPLDLADTVVFGHFPEALTVGICLRYSKWNTRGGYLLRRAAFGVCMIALILSGSRTWIVVVGAMMLAGASWLRGRGRLRVVLLTATVLGVLFLTPMGSTLFTKGFDVAIAEITPARYTEMRDIGANWRGFEAWQGWRAYVDGSSLQHAIGQGFGATADLGFHMELAGDYYDRVGLFHNGFIWPLLKTGYIGMAVFVWWFWSLIGLCRALAHRGNAHAADLCLGVVVSFIPTTLVVSGIFNNVSNDPMVLVLGGFAALAHRRPKS